MVKASELILKDVAKVDADAKISEAFSVMLKRGESTLAVFSGDAFLGLLTPREFLRRKRIYPELKVKTIVESKVPFLSEEDDLRRIAEQMYQSGARLLPVMSSGKIIGFVHIKDVLSNALEDERVAKTKLESICSETFEARKDDTIAKALAIMRKMNVKQIPIVDDVGNYCGVVTLSGLIEKYFIHSPKKTGLFSLSGKEPEAKKILGVKIQELMEEAKTFRPSDTLKAAKEEIVSDKSILLIEAKKIRGIVTTKDVLKATLYEERPYLKIQISGMPALSSLDEEKAKTRIKAAYEKLERLLPADVMLSIHFKSQRKKGMRARHLVKAKVTSGKFSFNASSESWNLLTALEDALSVLQKEALKSSKMKYRKGQRI
ncbi:MAG: CBS domain-containing protein [Candidatus Diapherotrites archaeon]